MQAEMQTGHDDLEPHSVRRGKMASASSKVVSFIQNRNRTIYDWAIFGEDIVRNTTRALVRFPVYGLFNPKSMLPVYAQPSLYTAKSRMTQGYEYFAKTVASVLSVPGFVLGGAAGLILGGVFGQKPQPIFGYEAQAAFARPSYGQRTQSNWIANYLNDHVLRKSTVQYGMLGALATGALLAVVGFGFALNAGMTVAMASTAVVAALPAIIPAMISVGALGAAFGFARGVSHKWHVDKVRAQHALMSSEVNRSSKNPSSSFLQPEIDQLLYLALNGDTKATAKLASFEVGTALRLGELEQIVSRINKHLSERYEGLSKSHADLISVQRTTLQRHTIGLSTHDSQLNEIDQRLGALEQALVETKRPVVHSLGAQNLARFADSVSTEARSRRSAQVDQAPGEDTTVKPKVDLH